MFKELIANGLFGSNLVLIKDQEIIDRYNACLSAMGLSPTKRKRFHIDRMGWSPEIAHSCGDPNYLSHGDANPLVIIVTPEQAGASIHYPFHSFDWALMDAWYKENYQSIVHLTELTGIWLDIDQDVDAYRDEVDLIMVDGVTVRAHTPQDLMDKAVEQQKNVEDFLQEKDLAKLCRIGQHIADSTGEIGDFRNRRIHIPDFEFSGICTFFTRAFGGSFVLCGVNECAKKRYILNKYTAKNAKDVNSIIDQNILKKLEDMGLISYDLAWWQLHVHILEILRDSFLIDELEKKHPDSDFFGLNSAQQKKMVQSVIDQLPPEYAILDHLAHFILKGEFDGLTLDKCIHPYLAHPSDAVSDSMAIEIILHILTLVCDNRNVLFLYRYDKEDFFEAYEKWSNMRRKWATASVLKHYKSRTLLV